MNMFKKAGGFTLVELIVVIAILAILAGVAIPVYSGYINNANETVDQQEIEAINTALSAAVAMEGLQITDAGTYISITFNATTKVLTVTANAAYTETNNVWANFQQFYKNNSAASYTVTMKAYATLAVVNADLDLDATAAS